MSRIALLMIWLASCGAAHSQSAEDTFREVGKRLDAIDQGLARANTADYRNTVGMNGAFAAAFEQVQGIVTYLQGNPYMRVKGFKVSFPIPPKVEIEFDTTLQKDKLPITDPAAGNTTSKKK